MGKPRKVKPASFAAGKKQAPRKWAQRDKPTTAEILWNKVIAAENNAAPSLHATQNNNTSE